MYSLHERFSELQKLQTGWDDNYAVSVNPMVLRVAYRAMEILFSTEHITVPELGAVEDGRLDISWCQGKLNVFCALDENEVRIFTEGAKKVRDIPLEGDENAQAKALSEILRTELTSCV